MLLYPCEKMFRHILFCKDDRFSEQCAAFGPADIKYIAETGDILHRHIGSFRRQSVRQTGAVQIQRHVKFMTDV